ncbi:MAG: lysophospholipid acyltransferase family protein [Bacteriovoracia bacterium]
MISLLSSMTDLNLTQFTKGIFKYFLFVLLMIVFILHHSIVSLLVFNERSRLRYFLKSISLTSGLALKVLNIKVVRTGGRGEVRQKLIVANHLSYLDVLILFSNYPSLFVTSVEIRETFFLGEICKLAGCFFVERRKAFHRSETKFLELKKMKEKFSQGFNIFLFPEGTSTDGSCVLPFKSTFFQLAVDTQTKIQPMCLKYTGENAHVSPWHGDMTFHKHLFKVCLQSEITANLTVLEEVEGSEKLALAKLTHEIISDAYEKN